MAKKPVAPPAEAPATEAPAKPALFTQPGRPTGLPPGVDPAAVQDPGEEAVTPEEQKQYDQIVRFAANLIYKNPKQTLAAMNHADLPIHQAVGRHAATIAEVIEKTAKANKDQLDPDVFWHAGSEVIEMLMDLGVQAKAFPLDPESEQYQQEAAMALMEAEKIVGEKALKDPKQAQKLSAEAGDVWAWGIAKEVDAGQASPAYMKMVEQARQANSPVRAGVQAALRRPQQ